MQKRIKTFIFILACSPFLIQCATKDDIQVLNYRIRDLNKKVEDMKANTVGEMRKRQADSSGQLDDLHRDMLELKSQLEETAHLNRRLQEQNKELELNYQNQTKEQNAQFETRLAELNTEVEQQRSQVKNLQDARLLEAERKAAAAAKAAEAARLRAQRASARSAGDDAIFIRADRKKVIYKNASSATPVRTAAVSSSRTAATPAPAQKAAPPKQSSSTDYQAQGQAKFDAGKYQAAFDLFQKHIDKNGSGSKTLQARYMMGECLYKQQAYDQAILQYQKIVSSYPGHPMTSKAMFRQAMSFEQLTEKGTAKLLYETIISSYGSSPEAVKAKKKLSQL